MIRVVLLVPLFLMIEPVVAEQLFRFNLVGYPKTTRECKATAEAVGHQFQEETKTKVLTSKCARNRWLSYDLEIAYTVEKELDVTQSAPWPVHNTFEDCMKSLSSEQATFTLVTGLKPFLKYCSDYSETLTWERTIHRYTAFFYALGSPKSVQRSLSLHMHDGIPISGKEAAEEIVEKSQASGVPAKVAYIDGRSNESDLWIYFILPADKAKIDLRRHYLLKNEIEKFWLLSIFEQADPLKADSGKQCLVQLETARKTFALAFTSPVVWFCMWDRSLFRSRLYHLRIKPGPESFEKLVPGDDGEPFVNEYATKEKCEEDKPKILAHYKTKLGENLVGALCSFPLQAKPHIPIRMFVYALRD